ncbi:MAG TPA: hypothetical protein VM073_00410 [Usitatibacter sp.]|nr:hypothetical protein [Usitatibacter sp.]
MNHKLWSTTAARVLALTFVIAGLAACDRTSNANNGNTPKAAAASPSAVVVGQAPAAPTGDPPGTTPVAGNSATSDVTKSVESNSMPQPGQPNDHSNVAPLPSQKADEIARTPEEGKAANNGERTR